MADTPQGETVTPEAPSNVTSNPSVPPSDTTSGDVEAAKKEAEQARLRANQLQNQLDKIKAEQDAARQKQLEENEQFKQLAEERQAKLDAIEQERAENEKNNLLKSQTLTLLNEYSPAVKELAETAGLTLTDDSDEAKAELKAKLDTFASKVGSSQKVTANNPAPTVEQPTSREQAIKTMQLNNIPTSARRAAEKAAIGSLESIKAMKAQNNLVEEPLT